MKNESHFLKKDTFMPYLCLTLNRDRYVSLMRILLKKIKIRLFVITLFTVHHYTPELQQLTPILLRKNSSECIKKLSRQPRRRTAAAHMAAAAGSRHDNNNRRAPYIFPFLASYWKTLAADAL